MIVLARGGRLGLGRPLDHAALAGRFAEAWGNARFDAPEPLPAVALAAARHDEGWRDSDDALRFDDARARPLSFLDGTLDDYVRLYAAGIDRIASIDPYAGLLVSMHGSGNVCGRWGAQPGVRISGYSAAWDAAIEAFALEQEAVQARLKMRLIGAPARVRRSVFERRLWAHYELLQVWDRLSLFVCRSDPDVPAEMAVGEAPARVDEPELTAFTASISGHGVVAVDPWPFRSESFDVDIPVVWIEDRPYRSAADVRAAVEASGSDSLRYRVSRSGIAGTAA